MAVAIATKRWTLEELDSMPDDGNKYELVHGQLFVTPAPRQFHQHVVTMLATLLTPYVVVNNLGLVWQARSIIRWRDNEVEPDLFVRAANADPLSDWNNAPSPILVVEVLSDSTRRRDLNDKRQLYIDEIGIPEYWAVDPDSRHVRVVRRGLADVVAEHTLTWEPTGATGKLVIDPRTLFAR